MQIVRYLVGDVDKAVNFYVNSFGFALIQKMGTAFAKVSKGSLELWLSGPESSAARATPDGSKPEPGGWNRFVIPVEDLVDRVKRLKEKGVIFRHEVVVGPGGKQILAEDPFGNPIELFESA